MEFLVALFIRSLVLFVPELNGQWETEVISFPLGATGQAKATFNEQTLRQEQRIQWTIPVFGETVALTTRTLDYELRPSTTANVYEIDFVLKDHFKTALSAATAEYYNQEKECEIDTWQAGVPQSVLGKKCSRSDPALNAGDKIYTILKIDGQTLFFGKDEGTVPARRSRLLQRYPYNPIVE